MYQMCLAVMQEWRYTSMFLCPWGWNERVLSRESGHVGEVVYCGSDWFESLKLNVTSLKLRDVPTLCAD